MTSIAIILIVISAFAHTGWNMIGKSRAPTPEFLLLANTLGCLCLTPILFKYGYILNSMPALLWFMLAITGGFQAIYYTGVAKAYSSGDMSVIYPVMRSAPVLLVMGVNLAIGKLHHLAGQQLDSGLSVKCIIGIVLVVLGGFLLPMESGSKWSWKRFAQRSTLLALVAAVGTCGYSIIDSYSLNNIVKPLVGEGNLTPATLIYGLLEGLSASCWLALFVFMSTKGREVFRGHLKSEGKAALLAGIGIYSAYCLVLVAMTFAKNVSYIVAFRQLGIPIAAVVGIVGLKEPCYPAKIVGIGTMLLGLVLVALK